MIDRKTNEIKRGAIWYVDLGKAEEGSCIQAGIRPCVVVSNDVGNKYSSVIQVITLTSRVKKGLPTHVYLRSHATKLKTDSIALCEQIISINKKQIIDTGYVSQLEEKYIKWIETGMKRELDLKDENKEEFNIDYAQELLENLNEFENLYKTLKSKFLLKMINKNFKELKDYCQKHNKDYEIYQRRYDKYAMVGVC